MRMLTDMWGRVCVCVGGGGGGNRACREVCEPVCRCV